MSALLKRPLPRSNPMHRAAWRSALSFARIVACEAVDPAAVFGGLGASPAALQLRDRLRNVALEPFPVAGASVEDARMAFVLVGKAVLNAGLPAQRARLARILDASAAELDGLLDDAAAQATAEQLRRVGAGD